MEKQLEQYKKALKLQNILYLAAAAAVAALIALSLVQVITPAVPNERWAGAWNGFLGGISLATFAIMVYGLSVNLRALRDDQRLRKLYIREHDERAQAISRCAGHMSYWFETMGLLLGVLIGGYFTPVISFVCLGCLMYICLVRLGLKLYYNKKL